MGGIIIISPLPCLPVSGEKDAWPGQPQGKDTKRVRICLQLPHPFQGKFVLSRAATEYCPEYFEVRYAECPLLEGGIPPFLFFFFSKLAAWLLRTEKP